MTTIPPIAEMPDAPAPGSLAAYQAAGPAPADCLHAWKMLDGRRLWGKNLNHTVVIGPARYVFTWASEGDTRAAICNERVVDTWTPEPAPPVVAAPVVEEPPAATPAPPPPFIQPPVAL